MKKSKNSGLLDPIPMLERNHKMIPRGCQAFFDTGILEWWNDGMLGKDRRTGRAGSWNIGMLECWNAGVPVWA
jgi:hypothetical protein